MNGRPNIVETIVHLGIALCRRGREFVGLCPFHDDHHPSLSVNPEKGKFLCRACQASGDVFDFVMRLKGVSFIEAKKSLSVTGAVRPARSTVTAEAGNIVTWANEQTVRANSQLREIGQRLQLAEELGWTEEIEIGRSEWELFETLAEKLQTPNLVIELYTTRAEIEALLADGEPERDEIKFPPVTDAYRERLRRLVRGEGDQST